MSCACQRQLPAPGRRVPWLARLGRPARLVLCQAAGHCCQAATALTMTPSCVERRWDDRWCHHHSSSRGPWHRLCLTLHAACHTPWLHLAWARLTHAAQGCSPALHHLAWAQDRLTVDPWLVVHLHPGHPLPLAHVSLLCELGCCSLLCARPSLITDLCAPLVLWSSLGAQLDLGHNLCLVGTTHPHTPASQPTWKCSTQ